MTKTRARQGYTLIELLLVISIVALLAVIAMPMFGLFREMATNASCVSRLRILHVGLNNYMQEHEMVWPQVPNGGYDDEKTEWKWWYQALKDYGVAPYQWICPGDTVSKAAAEDKDDPEPASSYIPTLFDDSPNTAFRWNQPWVIERGGFHGKGKGPNMLMPDGTVAEGPSFMAPQ